MSGDYVTVRLGPAIIIGHQDPHFASDGSCICSCSECATEDVRTPVFAGGDCICPACPCNQDPPAADLAQKVNDVWQSTFGRRSS